MNEKKTTGLDASAYLVFRMPEMRGERNIEIIWAQIRTCGLYHI
jgi:hypothetical protein